MQTGENEQGLRQIIDLTRMISIAVLLIHFYYFCYAAFRQWHLTADITDRLLTNIRHTGLFNNFYTSKLISLGFLIISLMGARGKKDTRLNYRKVTLYIFSGLLLFFSSMMVFYLHASS